MGEEAFQAEGRRVEAPRAGRGPSGRWGGDTVLRVHCHRGEGEGPGRGGGLGEVAGVQEGLGAEPRCGSPG